MLIPGSHKSGLPHPQIIGRTAALAQPGATADNVPGAAHTDEVTGAVEMFMRAGDALLFTDATAHGSAKRIYSEQRFHQHAAISDPTICR